MFGISRNRNENEGKTLLIINGAGGVGSIATQIAKAYGLRVITTHRVMKRLSGLKMVRYCTQS